MKNRFLSWHSSFLVLTGIFLISVGLTIPRVSLKEVYKKYFPVGAAIGYKNLTANDKAKELVREQFASITPENELKPKALQPTENVFTWTAADQMVDFAVNNKLKIRGHCLVWPLMTPRWMYFEGDTLASKEVLLKRLKEHIHKVVGRYKGKAYCWDVVNECVANIGEKTTFRKVDTLFMIAGEEYVEKGFEYAHEADPTAKLFYNDNGFDLPVKRDRMFNFLKHLKEKGVPVHGVGMQTHLGIEGMPEAMFRENIDMFASLGLEVQITELDVSIYKVRPKPEEIKKLNEEYTPDVKQQQAAVYDMIFSVCREKKDKVTALTLWSAYDWDNFLYRKFNKKNYPYLFDEQLKPKDVFYKVVNFKD